MSETILSVKNLQVSFQTFDGKVQAVRGIDFDLKNGETLAIVGESGSGKSVTTRSIMQLLSANALIENGEIIFEQENILEKSESEMQQIRGKKIAMIFQDPMTSLDPTMKVGMQVAESMIKHLKLSKKEALQQGVHLLEQVGIPHAEKRVNDYPHQFSGGQRQRIVIAIALACNPDILIADEPTTALDVTIQAQILDLLNEIQAETQSGIILITHDLGVVAETADRVAVMYAGQFVEIAPVEELFTNPKHPYTRSLLQSIPQAGSEGQELHVIEGTVPPLPSLPRTGCRFAPRIPWISAEEHEENPTLHEVGQGHFVRCTCYKNFHFEGEEA